MACQSHANRIKRELARLLEIPSPTGMCSAASQHVQDRLAAMGLALERKRDGALCTIIKGKDHHIPAAGYTAHLDTLGAQVKRIKDNGRLELVKVGTWSSRFSEGARVKVHINDGILTGTIVPLKASGHAFGEEVDKAPVNWSHVELRIDAETFNRENTIALGVKAGDFVSIDPQPEFLENGFLVSRFLDDKAAVAALLVAAEDLLAGEKPPRDVHLIFTVSEEIGTGAPGLVSPCVADLIALDIGIVAPEQESREDALTICMADESGPYNRELSLELEALCECASIPVQRDVFNFYKSDLASARLSGTDARMALMTFGVDASHGYERTHIRSLVALTDFLIAYALKSPLQGS